MMEDYLFNTFIKAKNYFLSIMCIKNNIKQAFKASDLNTLN